MKRISSAPTALLPLLVAAILLCDNGCATSPSSPAGKKSVAADEWVSLPPATGSNLPRRVRRSELGTAASATPVDSVSSEALNNPDRSTALPMGSSGK